MASIKKKEKIARCSIRSCRIKSKTDRAVHAACKVYYKWDDKKRLSIEEYSTLCKKWLGQKA